MMKMQIRIGLGMHATLALNTENANEHADAGDATDCNGDADAAADYEADNCGDDVHDSDDEGVVALWRC